MSAKNSIQVAIKVRPLLRKEKDLPFCWRIVDNSIQLVDGQTEPYYFDHIFDEKANNQAIFDKMAKHIVHASIQGFNGTIFAYGQTSSGKTYTMMGDTGNPGVMMLAIKEIFKEIERATDRQFLLRVGYIEMYNEKFFDLLNKKNQDLKLHETPTGVVSVNCEENIVTCEEDMLQNLCAGNKERTVGETNMNERSSRSHAIFRIIIESRKVDRSDGDDAVIQSVLNLVDLAGSERADQTGASGARLKEGAHINKSLLFLSKVIKQLSENEEYKHVSFRDSKLTRILQVSLGGNALTSIICTIKPTVVEETQSTLNFALRAKAIKNKPHVNEIVTDATMMKRLEREVKDLKALLEEERNKNESKIKVGQLEQRIKDEDHKIVSCNSLQYIRMQKDKRRRTWCPGVTTSNAEELPPTSIIPPFSAPPTTSVAVPPKQPHLRKPNVYLTPHITLRDTPIEALPKFPTLGIQTDAHIAEVDELFEPGEFCDFIKISPPSTRDFDENARWNTCRTPEPLEPVNLRTLSLTPKASASVDMNLKKAETELRELQEFTNLENQIDVKHDTYEALNQKLVTLTNRNAFLEKERLEHLEMQDELNLLKQNLCDSERHCNALQIQLSKLTKTNQTVSDKIAKYEKQITELNDKIEQLEMENRDVVSLEFEFQRHKKKSKLREDDLLEALSEKNNEVSKLEKSLNRLLEEKLQGNKENLMHLSHNSDSTRINGGSEIPNGNACVKCEDWQLMLKESKKVKLEFDKLTLEYNELQLKYNQATKDAKQAKTKLAKLEAIHKSDELECNKLRAQITTLRESLERLQREYTQLNCDSHAKTEDSEKLNKELLEARDAMHHMQERYNKLEMAWLEEQKTISEIKMEYDVIQQKYQSLQAEYEKLEQTSQQSLENCKRLQYENEKLQLDINELKLRVGQAQQKLMNGDTGTSEPVDEAYKLKRENSKLREEVQDVQRQYDELQKEYNDLSNQLMDSLQDGEAMQEEYEKLELKIKTLQEKAIRNESRRVEADRELEAAKGVCECSDELETCSSESMRSSGVCMESSVGGVEHLMKFTKLMETLQEIELEHEVGKVRVFKAAQQLDDAKAPPCKLLLKNIKEIVTHEHNELSGHNANVCMQGMLKRHTFHIVELGLSETVGELEAFDCSKQTGKKNENDEHYISSAKELQLRQEICQLNETNAELRSLLESTEHVIRELREQINTLTAELLEKSQCLEKCACEDYQKQISIMEKEIPGLSLIDDFLNGVVSTMDKSTNGSDVSTEEDNNVTLSKTEQSECCRELQNAFDKQFKGLHAEWKIKQKLYEDKISQLRLEFYEKLELNETQFRDNLRKYNRKWEEGKEEYETEIKNLKEQLDVQKKELIQAEQKSEEHQSRLKNAKNKLNRYDNMFEKDPKNTKVHRMFKDLNRELEAENVTLSANCKEALQSLELHKAEEQRLGDQILKLRKLYKDSLEGLSMYHELEKKFNAQQDTLDELREDNNKLHVELPTVKQNLIEVREQKQQAEQELQALIFSRAELLEIIQSQNEIIKKLSQETENLKITLDYQETGRELSDSECEELKSELNSENTIEVLQQEKNKLQITLVQIRSEKSATESKYENIVQTSRLEKESLLDQLKTEKSAIEAEYEKSLKTLRHENENLLLTFDQLKREKTCIEEKEETLRLKFNDMSEELHDMRTKMLEYERLLSDHEDSEKALSEAKLENHKLSLQIETLEETLRDAVKFTQHMIEGEKKAAVLQQQLQTAKAESIAATQEQQSLRTQLETLESKLASEEHTLQCQNKELQDSIAEMRIKFDSLQQANEQLQQTNNNLSMQLKAAEVSTAECLKLRTELSTLTTEHDKLQLHIKSTANEAAKCNDDMLREKDNLQITFDQLQKEKSCIEEKEETLRLKIDDLSQELHDMKTKMLGYDQLLCDYENLEKALSVANLENHNLNLKIKTLEEASDAALKLTQHVVKEETKVTILEQQLDTAKAASVAATQEQLSLRSQLETLKSKLTNEEHTLQCQNKELLCSIAEMQIKFDSLQQANEQLQQTNANLSMQLKAAEVSTSECMELHTELSKLKAAYEKLQLHINTTANEAAKCTDALRKENCDLQLTIDEFKKEKSCIGEKEETLRLKIDDISQELHAMKTKVLKYEQLLSDHEDLQKALGIANLENQKLSLQIETLEEALRDALKNTQHIVKGEEKVADLEQQLQTAKAESIAATQEQQSLRTQLETLESKLVSEEHTLQCQNKELQATIAEMRIKFDSLQQANERLQQTNANLSMQLEAAEVNTAECMKLRTELSTLTAERDKLQLNIKTAANEAAKCSDALRSELTQQKQLVEQHLQSYNKLRTLLNMKETNHKDDKQKLEGTISCLLLEKKNLEDRLQLSEAAQKRYENEFTASQLKFESANSSIELNSSCSPRSTRGTSEIHPLKSIIDVEDKISVLQKKTLQMETVERKNRRLSTHDERRRQSLLGAKHNVASMTETFELKCIKCADLERKLKDCETNLFINESRVTALKIELKNHPLKAENASLKKRLQEEQDKYRIEMKRYKQIILEKTTKATHAIDLAAAATESKIGTNAETQTESQMEDLYQKLNGKYSDLMNICRSRYKYIKELEVKIEQKENTDDNRSISSLEAGQMKSLKTDCDLLKNELTVVKKKYEDAKKVLHLRREEIDRLTALVDQLSR